MTESQIHTTQFIERREEAKDTMSFIFKRPTGFEFDAGQYNRWILPGTDSNGKTSSHFFTISSAPHDENLMFTTKLTGSEYKNTLLKLTEGDEIKIFGPMGNFTLGASNNSRKVFLAGGIGITPFHSMLRFAAAQKNTEEIFLFTSFSTPEEIIFQKEFEDIIKSQPNLHVVYTVTHPEGSSINWQGETGRITPELIQKYIPNFSDEVYYIAGPGAMVNGMKIMLGSMQILDDHILTEEFPGY